MAIARAAAAREGANSKRSFSIGIPSRARRTAGAIRSASVNLPEPNCARARAKARRRCPARQRRARNRGTCWGRPGHRARGKCRARRRGRRFAIVDGDVLVAVGEMHHHEAAAADDCRPWARSPRAQTDRDGGIDRVAAALARTSRPISVACCLLARHHSVRRGRDLRRGGAGAPGWNGSAPRAVWRE